MNAFVLNDVRPGFYLDSVALMRLSREVAGLPGVNQAALMMATPSNRAILAEAGLLKGELAAAQGNDLIIAIAAASEDTARSALEVAVRALEKPKPRAEGGAAVRPRTIASALSLLPDANLALVSVPGDFAAAEARKALRRGLHVMMFSDNVSLEDERSLKEEARDRGLLVMGPDCGTAIIAGAPLAFANRVRRGDIGIVGASGTGTQEVSCLISEAGRGVSHAIGVGGRDLKREIGGITTLMAIEALETDPGTRHLVLVSKPPHPEVAKAVIDRLARGRKPFTVCFLGGSAIDLPSHGTFARTLAEAAEAAIGRRRGEAKGAWCPAHALPRPPRGARRIEGLFCGGTLCAEAQVILAAGGRKLVSNAPVPGVGPLSAADAGGCDRLIDLGDDEHTRGRPHPMIEPAVRDEALGAALADKSVAVVLLDVVIGFGAHDDPAGHLVEVLGQRRAGGPAVVASVTGTEEDRQVRSRQVARLEKAGVLVAPSNAEASRLALAIVTARR